MECSLSLSVKMLALQQDMGEGVGVSTEGAVKRGDLALVLGKFTTVRDVVENKF